MIATTLSSSGEIFRNSDHPGKERERESGGGANHRTVWVIIPEPAGSLYILYTLDGSSYSRVPYNRV